MLSRYSFENYRAFKKGSIRIAPITILVGANSIGKSSIIQIPNLLRQTLEQADAKYKAALKIHGKDVSFGGAKQVFHNLSTEQKLILKFDFHQKTMLEYLQKDCGLLINELIAEYSQLVYFNHYNDRSKNINSKSKVPTDILKKSEEILESFNRSSFKVSENRKFNDILSFLNQSSKDKSPISKNFFITLPITGQIVSQTDFDLAIEFVQNIQKIESGSFSVEYGLGYHEDTIEPSIQLAHITLYSEKKIVIKCSFFNNDLESIESDFIQKKIPAYIVKSLQHNVKSGLSIFNFLSETKNKTYILSSIFVKILNKFNLKMQEEFSSNSMSHIGPLRAYPRRFYFLDTAQAGSSNGELMVEALRENIELREKVNKWLHKFEVNIDVSQFQEIIYKVAVRSRNSLFDLDITDVGFGISQILPILVEGFLSTSGKTITIEQPEIHLHPKMQAELGDLLIDIAGLNSTADTKRTLIVETHSENLLNRLRLRIKQGKIRNSDLAIHNIERVNGDAIVRGIYIPERGDFEWPMDFLDATLEDTISIIKASL
jgi:predicted ATPase